MSEMEIHNIGRALIDQVTRAVPEGGCERNVRTYISRPMWRLWCRFVGEPEDSEPSACWGIGCNRVYGSETVIAESDRLYSYSFAQ